VYRHRLITSTAGLFDVLLDAWTTPPISGARSARFPHLPLRQLDPAPHEARTISGYGLPWRNMFRGISGKAFCSARVDNRLLLAMPIARVFYFGSIGLHGAGVASGPSWYALVFMPSPSEKSFRALGYPALFTLTGRPRFSGRAAILSAAYFGYSHHGNSGLALDRICLTPGAFGLAGLFLAP